MYVRMGLCKSALLVCCAIAVVRAHKEENMMQPCGDSLPIQLQCNITTQYCDKTLQRCGSCAKDCSRQYLDKLIIDRDVQKNWCNINCPHFMASQEAMNEASTKLAEITTPLAPPEVNVQGKARAVPEGSPSENGGLHSNPIYIPIIAVLVIIAVPVIVVVFGAVIFKFKRRRNNPQAEDPEDQMIPLQVMSPTTENSPVLDSFCDRNPKDADEPASSEARESHTALPTDQHIIASDSYEPDKSSFASL